MVGAAVMIALIAFFAYMGDALGYSQYDRPIFTGLLVGWALGDVKQGLLIGASLELVYMGTLTIGGAFPPDIYTGGILGTAFAITTGAGIEGAVALSLPIATFALLIKQLIYTFVRGYFVHRADAYALKGDDKKVAAMHVWSTLAYCVPMAIVVGICFYVGGPVVQAILDKVPRFIMAGLSAASGMLPALGFAMLIKMIISKELAPYFFIGFLIAGYLNIPVLGIACIAICIAILVIIKDGKDKMKYLGGADDNEF